MKMLFKTVFFICVVCIVESMSLPSNLLMSLTSNHLHHDHILKSAKLLSCERSSCFLVSRISVNKPPEFNCNNNNLEITVYFRTAQNPTQEETAQAFIPPIEPDNVNNNILVRKQNETKLCRKIRR